MSRERTKHECTLRPRFRTCETIINGHKTKLNIWVRSWVNSCCRPVSLWLGWFIWSGWCCLLDFRTSAIVGGVVATTDAASWLGVCWFSAFTPDMFLSALYTHRRTSAVSFGMPQSLTPVALDHIYLWLWWFYFNSHMHETGYFIDLLCTVIWL